MTLEFIAAGMGAAGFVKLITDVWDGIEAKIQKHREAKVIARELRLFGVSDQRQGLKIDLELAQRIARDRNRPQEEKLQLAEEFKHLSDSLNAIPSAADAVIELVSKRSHLFRSNSPIKALKTKVESFSEASRAFHQKVISLGVMAQMAPPLHLNTQDFVLIGLSPEIVRVSETTYAAKASFANPNTNESEANNFLLEPIQYTDESESEITLSVQALAAKLQPALAHWNIPHLIGYRDNPITSSMELVFQCPVPPTELTSLFHLYTTNVPEPSLNIRLELCYQLAVAVLQTHELGLLHKNIRPGNLIIAAAKEKPIEKASLLLSGWQIARPIESTATKKIGESSILKIMYQHPSRRLVNNSAAEGYKIGHDVYSLGVCMLELLTWDILVQPGKDRYRRPVLSDTYKEAFKSLGYHEPLDVSSPRNDNAQIAELYTQDSKKIQNTLKAMAKTYLPRRAGNTMTDLVYRCLTCLDLPATPEEGTFATSDDSSQITNLFDLELFNDFNKLLSVI
ncbi:hypothetical protein ABW19_dt0208489 [Dactylella cylindrospora]|nr:hypothetical protein ABW19_dt0208489 [Dactylella cylindrospora]